MKKDYGIKKIEKNLQKNLKKNQNKLDLFSMNCMINFVIKKDMEKKSRFIILYREVI